MNVATILPVTYNLNAPKYTKSLRPQSNQSERNEQKDYDKNALQQEFFVQYGINLMKISTLQISV